MLEFFYTTNDFDKPVGIRFQTIGKGVFMFILRRLQFDSIGSFLFVSEVCAFGLLRHQKLFGNGILLDIFPQKN